MDATADPGSSVRVVEDTEIAGPGAHVGQCMMVAGAEARVRSWSASLRLTGSMPSGLRQPPTTPRKARVVGAHHNAQRGPFLFLRLKNAKSGGGAARYALPAKGWKTFRMSVSI